LLQSTYDQYNYKKIDYKWLDKLNMKKYKKAINKWYKLSLLMGELPDFIEFCKSKDIVFDYEQLENKLSEAEYFKKGFDYYHKEAEDGSGRLHECD
jgi:hypothetical protein